jgi:hypothetical protein
MSILVNNPIAQSVKFDADSMWVEFADGRRLAVPLAYFPRLLHATARQRTNYTISGGGTGLHWDKLDEDICVKSLVAGVMDKTHRKTTKIRSKLAS